jgi:predicted DCC family thiol-disulfide oxidoreductase YuxK
LSQQGDPVARLAPLLVVYDAESHQGRRWVDWIQKRDSQGLIVPFPCQNPELVRIAPELAGRPLQRTIHGLDTLTRQVWAGENLPPQVWARLPGWRWVIFLTWIPGISRIITKLNWMS